MMHEIGFLKRLYYNYLSYLYWFTHFTSTHNFLGIRFSTIVKLLAVALVLAAWIYNWGDVPLIITIIVMAWVFLAYWRAGRSGYFKFVAENSAQPADQEYEKLSPYRRVPCIATGTYSVHDWEKNVLLKPADYWQVPRGDHGLMVEHEPHRYLYQFFNIAKMHDLKRGWLLYGSHPRPALSISYLSIWGPEFEQEQYSILGSERKPVDPKLRTIYLSFPSAVEEEMICQNILSDIQQYKIKKEAAQTIN